MPTPTSLSLTLEFNLGPRHFRVWSDPLQPHQLTIQETTARNLSTFQMGFPRAWPAYEMEHLIKQAVVVITNRDHSQALLANANDRPVHLIAPRRPSAANRCPTCKGWAKAYRLEHGHSCPTCLGTGAKPAVEAKPTPVPAGKRKLAKTQREFKLSDIGL